MRNIVATISIAWLLTGCASPPPDDVVREKVEKAFRKEDVEALCPRGGKIVVQNFEISDRGKAQAITDSSGMKRKVFPFKVRLFGKLKCNSYIRTKLKGEFLISAEEETVPESEMDFDKSYTIYFFKDDFDEWKFYKE